MDERTDNRLSLSGTLALVLILVLGAYFLADAVTPDSSSTLSTALKLNTIRTDRVQVEGDRIYYLESGSLHCINSKGKYIWNSGVNSDSDFLVTEYGIAVWSGNRLFLLDKNTGAQNVTKNMSGTILNATVGDSYVAVVLGPEHNSSVVILDLSGNEVDNLTDLNGVTVLNVGFFSGRELFWLMTLDSTGSTPACKIATYKPGKRETGSISDMEQVIYHMMFRSTYIVAVGTDYIKVYDYYGSEQTDQRITVYGWYLEALGENGDDQLMLFVPGSQSDEKMEINDVRAIKGSKETMLHMPISCTCLRALNDKIYGFAGEYLTVCDLINTSPVIYKLPVMVDSVIGITNDGTAVTISGSGIYLINLNI